MSPVRFCIHIPEHGDELGRQTAVSKKTKTETHLKLLSFCRRHHRLRCQQVAIMLQGKDSPGESSSTTPAKKNETFDVQ